MSRKVHLLQLQNASIEEQLRLEEALLRLTDQNWVILNVGSPPSIVMGISGKPEELISSSHVEEKPIPLIKRYSGGGTVVVDGNTLFVSFIFQKELLDCSPFPEPILRWSEKIYQNALNIPSFHLRENDYAIGDLKCGGNAQYLQKNRFVHHTTFLWDYDPLKMNYLLHPKKTPKYRDGRSHDSFLCRLKDFLPSKTAFVDGVIQELQARYEVEAGEMNPLIPLLAQPHRKSTTLFSLNRSSD